MAPDPDLSQLLAEAGRLRQAGRFEAAAEAYRRVLEQRPDLPDSWYNLGLVLRRAGRPEAALAAYGEALARRVSGPAEVHLNRAVILADDLRRPAEARAELEAALALDAGYIPALLNLGNLHEDLGQRDEARAAYERVLSLSPGHPVALARAAGVARVSGADDPLIGRLQQALADGSQDRAARAELGFALGRVLDAAGRYEEAFAAYARANRDSRASAAPGQGAYDRAAETRRIDQIIAAFRDPVLGAGDGAAKGEGPTPVFIVGMFRSGSTLVEQVLASHPRVTSGGELDILPRLARRRFSPWPMAARFATDSDWAAAAGDYEAALAERFPQADIVTDKRPDNLQHVGLIKRMYPGAKIIHTVRQPLDNALSVFFLHLDHRMAWGLDIEDTLHFMEGQARLAAHWRALYPNDMLTFDYDRFVADPRPAAERLLAFCGLEWDEACMAFHQAETMVRTASVWQVREPLYARSSGRWRRYERELRAVADAPLLAGLLAGA